jgi:hypothetical protein
MTPSEFKAWFEGFTEGLDGRPTEKQWERIVSRVKEIDGTSYVARWYPYGGWYNHPVVTLGATYGTMTGGLTVNGNTDTVSYSSADVMRTLGRDDMVTLTT